jgi:hypothetical protein
MDSYLRLADRQFVSSKIANDPYDKVIAARIDADYAYFLPRTDFR